MGRMNKKKIKQKVGIEKPTRTSDFQQVVENTQDIASGYKPGLQAIENKYRNKISLDSSLLNGSVDIDSQVKSLYPEDSRWDYVIGYNNMAYFVEVHPASTTEVLTMLNKVSWLEKWLVSKAPLLQQVRKGKLLYWIPSGNCRILKGSPQEKKLAQSNLIIVNPFKLENKIEKK